MNDCHCKTSSNTPSQFPRLAKVVCRDPFSRGLLAPPEKKQVLLDVFLIWFLPISSRQSFDIVIWLVFYFSFYQHHLWSSGNLPTENAVGTLREGARVSKVTLLRFLWFSCLKLTTRMVKSLLNITWWVFNGIPTIGQAM